ncbi:hypothetical protein [Streptomyces sp. NPDC059092]|uniref:hypothetical protein n=1 Tax=Streptomyces sp. NPDC059092 TaxID=3346725 RepID=UPI0036AC8661
MRQPGIGFVAHTPLARTPLGVLGHEGATVVGLNGPRPPRDAVRHRAAQDVR